MSPNIFPDADLPNAVNGVLAGFFAATGQICMAGSRVLMRARSGSTTAQGQLTAPFGGFKESGMDREGGSPQRAGGGLRVTSQPPAASRAAGATKAEARPAAPARRPTPSGTATWPSRLPASRTLMAIPRISGGT